MTCDLAARKEGRRSFNPHTPIDSLQHVIDLVDLVLIMSVNPGFGGQDFIPSVLPKISAARELIRASGRDIMLEVDGGIRTGTARLAVEAGANVLVAGNAVFKKAPYADAISALRRDATL